MFFFITYCSEFLKETKNSPKLKEVFMRHSRVCPGTIALLLPLHCLSTEHLSSCISPWPFSHPCHSILPMESCHLVFPLHPVMRKGVQGSRLLSCIGPRKSSWGPGTHQCWVPEAEPTGNITTSHRASKLIL